MMDMKRIKGWVRNNYVQGLIRRPKFSIPLLVIVVVYIIGGLTIGFLSNLFTPVVLTGPSLFYLPITLFVFPAFLEESFFRGFLIPLDTREKSRKQIILTILFSTVLFVIWHPANALTINPTAASFFLNPYFLGITFLLGLTCSILYIYTRSLWAPVALHWITVLVWVLLLGGRNKILEM